MGVDQFFEQTKRNILICIIAILSPQMFDKVNSKIIMGTHISILVVPW